LHQTLHGNGRGLTFFRAAVKGMTQDKGEAFEQTLASVKEQLQTDMALTTIAKHLNDDEKTLLCRMTAYASAVPIDGVIKIAEGSGETKSITADAAKQGLQRLLQCSMLEQQFSHLLDCNEYQCSPVVADWLSQPDNLLRSAAALSVSILQLTSTYQKHLFEQEESKHTIDHAIVVYQAFIKAEQIEEAYQFALDEIARPLTTAGFYQTLLDNWMPQLCQATEPKTKGQALGQTGKLHFHIGDYDTALQYLKRSVSITQDIGHKAGLCATLFNMGHIHWQKKSKKKRVQLG
jgi:tetratricopeptide (TPR) repeat protein